MFAAQKSHLEVAQLLLDEGADPDAQDDDGRTPIMHACQEGQVSSVKLLLQYQANINLKDAKGTVSHLSN